MVGDPEWLNSYMEGVSDILNSLLAGLACYSAPPPPNAQERWVQACKIYVPHNYLKECTLSFSGGMAATVSLVVVAYA